uniref:Chimadanin anti-thrombin-like protein n=1 Tax=Rhipicephalus zambeziensis TaxID=60191 RepID=A0A224YBS4_9ACAR
MMAKRLTVLVILAMVASLVIAMPKRKELRGELNGGAVQQRYDMAQSEEDEGGESHQNDNHGEHAQPKMRNPNSGGNTEDFESIDLDDVQK